MKQTISLILFLIASFAVSAQKIETRITWLATNPGTTDIIIYNPQQQLTIADFKGQPDASTDAVAITSSGFMFKAGYQSENEKGILSLQVYCSFNKNDSWMKERGKTAYILAHEQRHFDISYLSTLLFIKKVRQTNFQQPDFMAQLRNIYKEIVQQMSERQQQYDSETNNGINTTKQEEWNKRIEKDIAGLSKDVKL
ncbi:MAG TPA: DUF922 domain-containing protein [Ferruginibacter sp.]|nr:DUF922 domain-containing protein [Ferruginibacter sp.]HPH90049.1 DUF922 domain-containing protein [Ferruginibacter sp.]